MLLPREQAARVWLMEVILKKHPAKELIDAGASHETHIALLCHKGSHGAERDALPFEAVIR